MAKATPEQPNFGPSDPPTGPLSSAPDVSIPIVSQAYKGADPTAINRFAPEGSISPNPSEALEGDGSGTDADGV
jgi:hypothetical protein